MLFTDKEKEKFLKNGQASKENREGLDHKPGVKFFHQTQVLHDFEVNYIQVT